MKEIFTRENVVSITIALIVYVLNKSILMKHAKCFFKYFFTCYLNDLVCPLFFLGFAQIIFKWARIEIRQYRYILVLGVFGGFVWEFVAPIINPKSVADIFDFVCYIVGTNIYWFLIHNKLKKAGN